MRAMMKITTTTLPLPTPPTFTRTHGIIGFHSRNHSHPHLHLHLSYLETLTHSSTPTDNANNAPLYSIFLNSASPDPDLFGIQRKCQKNFAEERKNFVTVPVGCSVVSLNYAGGEPNPVMETMKGGMEVGSLSSQLKYPISLNNKSFLDKVGHSGYALNAVSAGLRLSYEEDEHNSSVTCANEGIKAALPIISSLGDNLKVEIDEQKKELECYIKFQEENIIKGLRELRQRHVVSFLSAIEKGISRELYEKELEIESMNHKNKELLERIKQVSMEVQFWQYRAKYSESVVNVLRNNLQQVMAQGVMHRKEACGDSEIEDVASCTNINYPGVTEQDADLDPLKKQVNCRACKVKEISVLILPCRHLCLCKDCEVFIDVCPICGIMMTASVEVFMS